MSPQPETSPDTSSKPPIRRRWSVVIRRTHLFFALFLTPWVLMYSVSTMVMQHRELITGDKKRQDPAYSVVDTVTLETALPRDLSRNEAALALLAHLDKDGSHRTWGNWDQGKLVVERNRPLRKERMTYLADEATVTIERHAFDLAYVLELLHRRRGFDQPYWANDAWAWIVDGVIVAIIIWAGTGLWMWWEMKPTRKIGAILLVAGIVLFAGFLVQM